jgi:hypothetical protein
VWGGADDVPVPADYDGDRRADIALFRPSTGTWHVLFSSTGMQSGMEVPWGDHTVRPAAFDHDGDGRADLAVLRAGGLEILLSASQYRSSVVVK